MGALTLALFAVFRRGESGPSLELAAGFFLSLAVLGAAGFGLQAYRDSRDARPRRRPQALLTAFQALAVQGAGTFVVLCLATALTDLTVGSRDNALTVTAAAFLALAATVAGGAGVVWLSPAREDPDACRCHLAAPRGAEGPATAKGKGAV
jgi:hypothetical protein